MKRKVMFMLAGITVMSLIGCSHGMMRGSVAMKTSENEAHVCMGNNEVKTGDKVNLFKNVCVLSGENVCDKVKIGEGTIIETLNEHYSVMRVGNDVAFAEGTIVEKQK